jgi:hypothetical protein
LAFCSSIFFAKASSCADCADFPSCGTGLSAEAVQTAKELIAQKIPITLISAKFCHRDICLTSGFALNRCFCKC